MRIDFDAYTRELTPPAIVVDGVTHTGRLLGFTECLTFQRRMQDETADGGLGVCRDLLTAVGLAPDVVARVLEYPPGVVLGVVRDFFAAAATVPPSLAGTPGTPGPTTS